MKVIFPNWSRPNQVYSTCLDPAKAGMPVLKLSYKNISVCLLGWLVLLPKLVSTQTFTSFSQPAVSSSSSSPCLQVLLHLNSSQHPFPQSPPLPPAAEHYHTPSHPAPTIPYCLSLMPYFYQLTFQALIALTLITFTSTFTAAFHFTRAGIAHRRSRCLPWRWSFCMHCHREKHFLTSKACTYNQNLLSMFIKTAKMK